MSLVGSRRAVLLGPRAFTPDQLPGLKLWLRADQGVQARGASQFTAASSQYLSIADNAALSTGDVDFFIAGWFYLDSVGAQRNFVQKLKDDGTLGEYQLTYHSASTTAKFTIWNNAGAARGTATSAATLSTTTWYFIMAYHDAVNDLVGISVNGSSFATSATTGVPVDSAQAFAIGSASDGGSYHDGRAAHIIMGKSPVGGGAALWTTIRDTLYDSGAGLDVGTLSSAQRTAWGVVSAWRLQEAGTGTRADSFGGNTLTNNNSVSGADGPFYIAAMDGDPVARWLDQGPGAKHLTQATASKRPLFKLNIVNGRSVVRADGTDDFLSVPDLGLSAGSWTFLTAISPPGTGSGQFLFDTTTGRLIVAPLGNDQANKVDFYDGAAYHNIAAAASGWQVLDWVLTSGGTGEIFRNGASLGSDTYTAKGISSTTKLFSDKDGSSAFLAADLETLILYSGVFASGVRKQADRYLGARIAVQVA